LQLKSSIITPSQVPKSRWFHRHSHSPQLLRVLTTHNKVPSQMLCAICIPTNNTSFSILSSILCKENFFSFTWKPFFYSLICWTSGFAFTWISSSAVKWTVNSFTNMVLLLTFLLSNFLGIFSHSNKTSSLGYFFLVAAAIFLVYLLAAILKVN